MSSVEEIRAHAVCIPYPAQGHVNPMMKLAKLLHHKGFHVTFVNTQFNHRRLLKSRGPDSLDGLPGFRFETIPDGLPPSDADDATQDIPSLSDSIRKTCLVSFRSLLAKLNDTHVSSNVVPPVSCIVSDIGMFFAINAAEELGIPVLLLWTASACGFLGYAHSRHLVQRGDLTAVLKDESCLPNGYMDTTIDWIPGLKKIRLKDLPSFLFTLDPNDIMLNFILEMIEKASKASAIVVNTFDALEREALDTLSSMFPPIYSIGPLHLLLNQIPQKDLVSNIGSNLWKYDSADYLEWLNSKERNSVIYVNFGSVADLTPPQMVEFAWGLANSKKAFLWVIRPDVVKDASLINVPDHEFVIETKDRGILLSWCPQEHVLSHPSIGGFLTHSGWNSMLESMCAGVPVLCWPFFADQQTNCRFACVEWGIGMEIDRNVKRDEVERLVRELMDGEKGKEMRKHAMEWKKMAEEAVGSEGTSNLNLDKVVNEVLLQLIP
ncbi:7-deoxyloganetin glucosyltransferase-like [Juglans microcarpa x Juglans regia]|uniref:7-deoxyloganetin glucosyltransferase-like n=1 Tax=Juglans microcarpa x Juglans regia TaxID=2249226 RepID=UPI001B7E1794|nr:7-deoxyloganetin glucosyltransferase-like [Juglans microcarpa x Juglans regia]